MEPAAVGRTRVGGPWVGFAPAASGDHVLVIGRGRVATTHTVGRDVLVALAIAYFEERLYPPPDERAATHADVGTLVRALSETEADLTRAAALREAVDAIDDGLGADVVVRRLGRALGDPEADLVAALDETVARLTEND
jgi:hypothetical protein